MFIAEAIFGGVVMLILLFIFGAVRAIIKPALTCIGLYWAFKYGFGLDPVELLPKVVDWCSKGLAYITVAIEQGLIQL